MRAYATVSRRYGPPYRSPAAGFTLLEVMVALVVLGMIMTTAFGALRLGDRSWAAGLERTGRTETMRTVTDLLQRQFRQALPLKWSEKTETTIAFDGTHNRVRFIAPAPQHQGATGLFEYTLDVEPHTDAARLVLYYRLHDPDSTGFQPAGSDAQRVLLVSELETAAFAYYGSSVKGEAPRWHSEWHQDAKTFPQMVRLRLVAHDAQAQWPELFLPLHAVVLP